MDAGLFLFLPHDVLLRLCELLDGWNLYCVRRVCRRAKYLVDEGPLGCVAWLDQLRLVDRVFMRPMLFKQLRVLHIYRSTPGYLTSAFYEALPRSLRVLELSVPDCFVALFHNQRPTATQVFHSTSWYKSTPMVSVAKVFDGLETLDMQGRHLSLVVPMIALLPSSIRHLRLISEGADPVNLTTTLPPALESLQTSSQNFNFADAVPPSLHRLILPRGTINSFPSLLGRELRELQLFVSHNEDLSFLSLATVLEKLVLQYPYSVNLLPTTAIFPPTLTHLDVAAVITEDQLRRLPPKLTLLSCFLTHALPHDAIRLLPRTLKTIIFHRAWPSNPVLASYDTHLSELPPSLTIWSDRLHKPFQSGDARMLPRSIKSIGGMPHVLVRDLPGLPSTFDKLTIPAEESIVDAIPLLPIHLTSLEYEGEKELPPKSFALLPRQLLILCMNSQTCITDEDIATLPRSLLDLSLIRAGKLTDLAFQHLPRCLRTLVLRGSDSLTNSAVAYLPSSLTLLQVRRSSGWDDRAIKHFPRQLQHLLLPSAISFTDAGFKDMPLTLVRLELPRCKQLTVEILRYLPWNLEKFNLRDNFNFFLATIPRNLLFYCRSRRSKRRRAVYY